MHAPLTTKISVESKSKKPISKFNFLFEVIKKVEREESKKEASHSIAFSEGKLSVEIDINQINIDWIYVLMQYFEIQIAWSNVIFLR